jgi:G3E family GTPase
VFNIQEALPQCRLDGVVSVIDADMLIRFPELGHTTRLQIEGADILLLNKIDLIEPAQVKPLETKLAGNQSHRGNCSHRALQGLIRNCCLELDVREKSRARNTGISPNSNLSHSLPAKFVRAIVSKALQMACRRAWFARRVSSASPMARSFSISWQGRWELEPFESSETQLVFIGNRIATQRSAILRALDECTVKTTKHE